jgi:hypothetical protein
MNINWSEITLGTGNILLAQSSTTSGQGVADVQGAVGQVLEFLPRLGGAVAIVIVGWVIAALAAKFTRQILNQTNIDNKIAAGISGQQKVPQVETLVSGLVYWSILLLTVVAILQILGLEVASRPLNNFLEQLIGFLPKILGAGIFIAAGWLLATVVRLVTIRGLQGINLDQRLQQEPQDSTGNANQLSLTQTIGNTLYWLIFLLFLVPVLDTLGLSQALQPIQNLVNQLLGIIPNILGAALIASVGWFLANVAKRIITNLLATTGIDHIGSRFGVSPVSGVQPLSTILGTIAYILILLPIVIASLNALKIDAISQPAIAMLQQILNALPSIFTAVGILIVAYFLGRFIADLVTSVLTSIGFNNIFTILGLPSPTTPVTTTEEPTTPTRTPSEIAGIVALVGILLFATLAAVDILKIPALTALVQSIVVVLGRILSGLVVFAIGLFLANLAFNIISSSGNSQAKILAQTARISIIALVSAMALQQIGVAPDIVKLAFGLLFGAIAVAIAIAFGLGGRDIAQQQVREWLDSFKEK